MKKVFFLCNWGESSESLLERFRKMTPNDNCEWGKIKGVSEINEADYFVVIEGIPKDIKTKIDNNKIILLKAETLTDTALEKTAKVCMTYNRECNFKQYVISWWLDKKFSFLENLKYNVKEKNIVCIISGKTFLKGHIDRLSFVKSFCEAYPGYMDVYGFGLENFDWLGESYKGELNYKNNCKYNGLIDYKYSLCIENNSVKNYISEKLYDSFLAWTVPIYYGCPNIFDFFKKDSLINFDIHDKKFIDIIYEKSMLNVSSYQIERIRKSRQKILYSYNLWAVVEDIINDCF